LITGGSSGIGKSIGEFLHHKGFIVWQVKTGARDEFCFGDF
jgi:NAD(P)-dependent dehydrogenase (short-subunit alcohol dehydrogenase family)